MSKPISTARFVKALKQLKSPGGNRKAFLQAHFKAPGRTSTATLLAKAAGYKSWRPLNLQYGVLARQVADSLEVERQGLGLLVEFNRPASVTNEHWLLTLRPEFAGALKQVGWVS